MGRASMSYRDLIPDRQGGRFIASHIRIPNGGPVPDYVHFHEVGFQMIYCRKGWVRLVYEDQGEPFVMRAGEIVLQPPRLRHRVLECSPGLEVVEISSPAVHATHGDPTLALPTPVLRKDRELEGQRFMHGPPEDGRIAAASAGRAAARIVQAATLQDGARPAHDRELFFGFVLEGAMDVACEGVTERIGSADAFVIPPGRPYALSNPTGDLAWLEITAPADRY
jgi:mannose-6-phosphate isomerase-like protein (cupin superfamily)